MPAVELAPMTDAQRDALRSCRFCTPNLARTHAWAWTDDPAIVALLVPGRTEPTAEEREAALALLAPVGSCTNYRRCSEPELREWEIHLTHPDAIALVCDLVDSRRG